MTSNVPVTSNAVTFVPVKGRDDPLGGSAESGPPDDSGASAAVVVEDTDPPSIVDVDGLSVVEVDPLDVHQGVVPSAYGA